MERPLAYYTSKSTLGRVTSDKSWWTDEFDPGDEVPVSGIYKCTGCGREVTSNKGDPFPPQNRHQHPVDHGDVRWRLNIRTNTTGES